MFHDTDAAEYVKLLVALVAILDIPGNVPVFLQQTGKFSQREKMITAAVTTVTTGIVLLAFGIFGQQVLASFGISIASFKVLGGLVVLLIALELLGLLPEQSTATGASVADKSPVVVGIFPLAVPLMAGPGAITAVMVSAHEEYHAHHDIIVVAVILSACAMLLIGLLAASFLGRVIGPVSQIILNRLLGVIVGALGVEYILEGLGEYFPNWISN
ncbi:MAG: MarC family protein [Rhizobiaceae bacterium]